MEKIWYVCTIMLKCTVENSIMNEWTCMEQIHILEASTDEEAFAKALKLGQSEEHFYTNSKGELVF